MAEKTEWMPLSPDGIAMYQACDAESASKQGRKKASMAADTIIGMNLAKSAFQLHGALADGRPVFRKKLTHLTFQRLPSLEDQHPRPTG